MRDREEATSDIIDSKTRNIYLIYGKRKKHTWEAERRSGEAERRSSKKTEHHV